MRRGGDSVNDRSGLSNNIADFIDLLVRQIGAGFDARLEKILAGHLCAFCALSWLAIHPHLLKSDGN